MVQEASAVKADRESERAFEAAAQREEAKHPVLGYLFRRFGFLRSRSWRQHQPECLCAHCLQLKAARHVELAHRASYLRHDLGLRGRKCYAIMPLEQLEIEVEDLAEVVMGGPITLEAKAVRYLQALHGALSRRSERGAA